MLREGYAIISGRRRLSYAQTCSSVWGYLGLLAGPIIRAAASLTRHGTERWKVPGFVPISAVLLGERVWALLNVADTTSPIYWSIEIPLLIVIMTAVLMKRGSSRAQVLTSIASYGLGAGVIVAGYIVLGSSVVP